MLPISAAQTRSINTTDQEGRHRATALARAMLFDVAGEGGPARPEMPAADTIQSQLHQLARFT